MSTFVRGKDVRVVTALAHVNVVVWMNGLLRPKLATEDLDGPVRDHLRNGKRRVSAL